jgi:CPA2 family monovalent cation:H+ antiporter-2
MRPAVLRAAGVASARVLVLAINDAEATRATAALARRLAPALRIVARANYVGEVDALVQAGANEVVPQEIETGVEIMARTLRHFLVPDDEIDRRVGLAREAVPGRRAAADPRLDPIAVDSVVTGIEVRVAKVQAGSRAAEQSLASLELRRKTGVNAIAWKRGDEVVTEVDPGRVLQPADILVLMGPSLRMPDAIELLRNGDGTE